MNKFFDSVKLFVTGLFLCGLFLISGKASAAEVNQEAMNIFRETVTQTSKSQDRPFQQYFYFVMPQTTLDLDFIGSAENDSVKLKGEIEFWQIEDNGVPNYIEVPFYVTQDKQNMTLYFEKDKKWNKMTSPLSAAEAVDMFATPSAQELEQMINFVKDVTVLKDNDAQRILLVKLDCAKIFEYLKAEIAKDPEIKEQKNNETVNAVLGYIETGLKNADLWYTWTVDKQNWQSVTMCFNLSGLAQSIANVVLNETAGATELEPIRQILETVAYYSECKCYVNFLDPSAKAQLEIPKKVLKAKEVKDFSDDDKSDKK